MANKKNTKKPVDLNIVWLAAQGFDECAPIGTYKVDSTIVGLIEKYEHLHEYHRTSIRWHLKISCLSALNNIRSETEFPLALEAGKQFFDKLKQLRQLAAEVCRTDVTTFSYLLAQSPPVDCNGAVLDPAAEIESIENTTSDLIPNISRIGDHIDSYFDSVYFPNVVGSELSNRTIRFTHYFIAELERRWSTIFLTPPATKDLPSMTELIFHSLSDFHYPLLKSQLQSDVWLSDRIRKQIFRN